ncbi:metallophosphoesterase [Teredinibacter sp. KSP-S5-2]|uniref:metallophosphoesterase n=1 Tax=Teredinibacter sp. KSP-S5-2 TaxID=3034506 RepID=UPI00293488DC|nr:metallophosphoesterase [Teredinibacter sp. KSP-S5-2]WNO10035.1 metallophosphoesterase [Teredinibacter sp. KSP-S5-2]
MIKNHFHFSILFVLALSVFIVSCTPTSVQKNNSSVTESHLSEPPRVLAVWSQVVGESSDNALTGLILPQVAMRFVVGANADPSVCSVFSVSIKKQKNTTWMYMPEIKLQPRINTDNPFNDITVCEVSVPDSLKTQWFAARLEYKGAVVRLDSKLVEGDTRQTVGKGFTSGKADNSFAMVYGPGSIGQRQKGEITAISIGDTGCRGLPKNSSARMMQACDEKSWPLSTIAESAAALNPDLVLHVGDYRYFLEEEVSTDSWLYWQKDFFPAAQPLLLEAPWVFGRGNHEMCQSGYFGRGYFQLFGTESENECVESLSPWFFDVAVGGLQSNNAPHRFVIIDTNDDKAKSLTRHYQNAINMTREPAGPKSVWWLTHIPAYDLLYYSGSFHTGDTGVRNALSDATTERGPLCLAGKCSPSLFLLGHQHLYQHLNFIDSNNNAIFPQHYIVGHGGVKVDMSSPDNLHQTCSYDGFSFNGTQANTVTDTRTEHGFVYWQRSASTVDLPLGWRPTLYNEYGDIQSHPTGNVERCNPM